MKNFDSEEVVKVSIELSRSTLERLDALRAEWGIEKRSAVIQRILHVVLEDADISASTGRPTRDD